MDALPLPVSTRRLIALVLVLAAAVVLVAKRLHAHAQEPALRVAPVRVAAPQRLGETGAAASVVVDVEGAVRRPGLVRLGKGSRVADAVARAGGTTAAADRTGLNLAAPVSDGQQVLVPRRGVGGSGAAASSSGGSASSPTGPVSLSTASTQQLDELPGVGPVTAQKIVDYRTAHGSFHTVEELDAIPGIGPARLADLKGLVVP
jgi:competence protein ComEA